MNSGGAGAKIIIAGGRTPTVCVLLTGCIKREMMPAKDCR
jgi:hypothetical protein